MVTRRGKIEDQVLSFWFGDRIPRTSHPLPTCWDELLDWTDDASEIFQTFLNREDTKSDCAISDNRDTTVQVEASRTIPSLDPVRSTRFVPLVAGDQIGVLSNLSSMERFDERGKFYSENVFVAVQNKQGQTMGILSVGQFLHLYTVLSRYSDLVKLLPTNTTDTSSCDKEKKQPKVCLICFKDEGEILKERNDRINSAHSEQRNVMVVLSPCSHELCSECYKRWVSRKYKCPFCRYDFSSQRTVRDVRTLNEHCTWQIMDDWNETLTSRPGGNVIALQQELEKDVNRMERRLSHIWRAILEQPNFSESLLRNYTIAGRTIPVFQAQGDLMVTIE